jgi:hypothetical protein
MQTMVTAGALRLPFRFQRQRPGAGRDFPFLQRRLTPRTVFMEIVSGQFLHSVLVPCNLRLVLCDGVRIPVPEASVDVAWSGRFLDQLHPDDRLEHLRSVRRSLASGGVHFCNPRKATRDVLHSFLEAGFSAVRCYAGSVRIPSAAARLISQARLRYAAR